MGPGLSNLLHNVYLDKWSTTKLGVIGMAYEFASLGTMPDEPPCECHVWRKYSIRVRIEERGWKAPAAGQALDSEHLGKEPAIDASVGRGMTDAPFGQWFLVRHAPPEKQSFENPPLGRSTEIPTPPAQHIVTHHTSMVLIAAKKILE
eukprot:1145222-Pelagomonas_calceolata.AAC.3